MQYAQLNEDGSYSHQITTSGNVKWDENNFCPAATLFKDGKAEQFRLVELHETYPPIYDLMTQIVIRDGGEFVDGKWQYHWRVDQLSFEQIQEKIVAKKNNFKKSIIVDTQKRLDDFAQTRGYYNIASACTYITSTVPKFAVEGKYCVEIRDATWLKIYEILDEIEINNQETFNSYTDVENELPQLIWPD
jgi:hypothetical protein